MDTLDAGPVEVAEPAWCVGHHGQHKPYRDDVTHNSARVKASAYTASRGLVEVMACRISWAPFQEAAPRVAVDVAIEHDFEAEDIAKVAQALRVAAMRLETVAAEAVRLRGELS